MSNEMNDNVAPPAPVAQTPPLPPRPKVPALPIAAPEPFSTRDLWRAATRPNSLVECVLGGKDRLGSTLAGGKAIWPLAALLMAASLLSTIPYSLLSPTGSFWKVSMLFTGSLLICFPSLYAFGQLMGLALGLGRSLALALILTAAAGMFTFAFCPIIWFITFSVKAVPESSVSPGGLSVFLLGLSGLLGIAQMCRCLLAPDTLARRFAREPLLVAVWLVLLAFITYRMARLLDVL